MGDASAYKISAGVEFSLGLAAVKLVSVIWIKSM